MHHYFSIMNCSIDNTRLNELVHIANQNPDLSMKLRKKYSKMSGIDLRYVDLHTALRGLACQGLIR